MQGGAEEEHENIYQSYFRATAWQLLENLSVGVKMTSKATMLYTLSHSPLKQTRKSQNFFIGQVKMTRDTSFLGLTLGREEKGSK